MAGEPGNLIWFAGDLYNPNGVLQAKIREDAEKAMDEYGLTAWQRELLYSLDRDKIAEALYWAARLKSPYDLNTKYADPERLILAVDEQVVVGGQAVLSAETKGVRCPSAHFHLISLASEISIPETSHTEDGGIERQCWKLTFDLTDVKPGELLRLWVDDGAGELVAVHPTKTVPA